MEFIKPCVYNIITRLMQEENINRRKDIKMQILRVSIEEKCKKRKCLFDKVLPEEEHEPLHKTAEVVMSVNRCVWLKSNVTKHLGIHGTRAG